MDGLSPYHAEERNRKLSDFFQSIASDSSLAEVVLLNITWNCFGITFGLIRFIVVIDIIRAKPVQSGVEYCPISPQ